MSNVGQVVGGLSPEAQVVLIVCLFALVLIVIMVIFMIIVDREKMRTATTGAKQVAKVIARLRKGPPLEDPPDSSAA